MNGSVIMIKTEHIRPTSSKDLVPDAKYVLTRDGKMSHHTGVYVFQDIFDSGECVLYSEKLKAHYTVPFINTDIKLYKVRDERCTI